VYKAIKSGGYSVLLAKLIKKLLNVNNIVIEGARFEWEGKNECLVIGSGRIRGNSIIARFAVRNQKDMITGGGLRRRRVPDFGPMIVFLEAEAPRVRCKEHGVLTEQVPWARHTLY
jgi:hypothetical protein